MKKILVLIAFAATLSTTTFAQTANLNITLTDVLSFTVTQPASLDVTFSTETDYSDGKDAVAADHITVTSSTGYLVKAIAGTVTGDAALDPTSVKITASNGSNNTGNVTGVTYPAAVTLVASGGTAATIIDAPNTSWDGGNSTATFDVTYNLGANGVYAGKEASVNVIPVIYTVTAQ